MKTTKRGLHSTGPKYQNKKSNLNASPKVGCLIYKGWVGMRIIPWILILQHNSVTLSLWPSAGSWSHLCTVIPQRFKNLKLFTSCYQNSKQQQKTNEYYSSSEVLIQLTLPPRTLISKMFKMIWGEHVGKLIVISRKCEVDCGIILKDFGSARFIYLEFIYHLRY